MKPFSQMADLSEGYQPPKMRFRESGAERKAKRQKKEKLCLNDLLMPRRH